MCGDDVIEDLKKLLVDDFDVRDDDDDDVDWDVKD